MNPQQQNENLKNLLNLNLEKEYEKLETVINNTIHTRTLIKNNISNSKKFFSNLTISDITEPIVLYKFLHYKKKLLRKPLSFEYNKTYTHDININNKYFLEIKCEVKAIQTQNVFVEFMQNNKLSGISVSKATHYIFIIPSSQPLTILIKTKKLKKLINKKVYIRVVQPNNYNNGTGGYIFPLSSIIKNAILI